MKDLKILASTLFSPCLHKTSFLNQVLGVIENNMNELQSRITNRYKLAGQEHVLQYLPELSSSEKVTFLKELDGINVENLSDWIESAKKEQEQLGLNPNIDQTQTQTQPQTIIEPFDQKVQSTTDTSFVKSSYEIGMKAIKEGSVCALVLAGGQGTRLGFDGPKGMYPLLLRSKSTLFQLVAERILKLQQLSGNSHTIIPWYIMTSPMNHETTLEFFQQNRFFGLKEENVILFSQGVLPCVDLNGKIILENKSKCSMAPDGNGGIYTAMEKNRILEDMEKRGIQYIHAFAIDNALVKPADPVFIGCCIVENADCGNKVLWKRDSKEKVGIVALKNKKPCVLEYSDMSPNLLNQVDKYGKLVYGAANICNHFYTLDFLQNVVLQNLHHMYHIAHKKIPYWNPETNSTQTPMKNNGIKLESFIFDVFPLSKKMSIMQVCRKEEFAPVKNAPGSANDSPDQAREMISNLAKSWVKQAGIKLRGDVDSNSCEISPLTSFGGEGIDKLFENMENRVLECPFHL